MSLASGRSQASAISRVICSAVNFGGVPDRCSSASGASARFSIWRSDVSASVAARVNRSFTATQRTVQRRERCRSMPSRRPERARAWSWARAREEHRALRATGSQAQPGPAVTMMVVFPLSLVMMTIVDRPPPCTMSWDIASVPAPRSMREIVPCDAS